MKDFGPQSERVMNRRAFFRTAGAAAAGCALDIGGATGRSGWRTFEVTTRVELRDPSGVTRVWVPAALIRETPYQRTLANTFRAEGGVVRMVESGPGVLGIIAAEFPAGVPPVLTVVSRVSTQDWAVNL